MPTTIPLPDDMAQRLQSRGVSLDEWVTDLLTDILESEPDDSPTLGQVIAEIKATRPDPAGFHPATQSLAEQFANSPDDPSFDARTWNRQWTAIEAEMKAVTRANDLAEGRG